MSERFKTYRCPMCQQKFVNPNKLNRHKRTCPGKDQGKECYE